MKAGSSGSGKNKRYSFKRELDAESDPAWRNWFLEIKKRQDNQTSLKKKPFVFSQADKDGESLTIVRKKSAPLILKTYLKKDAIKSGFLFNVTLDDIRELWKSTVDSVVSESTDVFSFKNGALVISVFNSALLQEIHQFHQEAIDKDLRDVWPFPIPLVRITFRQGRKK